MLMAVKLCSVHTGRADSRTSGSLFYTYTDPGIIYTGIHCVLIINEKKFQGQFILKYMYWADAILSQVYCAIMHPVFKFYIVSA